MGVLTWILFHPPKQSRTLLFDIFRQAVIIGFVVLSTFINPSLFTVTLMLVSLIEYSRHCRSNGLVSLYCVLTFAFWFAAYLHHPAPPDFTVRSLFFLFFKSAVGYLAIIFDHLTVRRFGFTGKVASVVFPLLAAGSAQFVGVLDQYGLCAHLSAFCTDYPDFTLLLFRLLGPAGPTLLVAFLASYISSWRSTRFLPQFISVILFKILPVTIICVSIIQSVARPPHHFLRVAVVPTLSTFNNISGSQVNLFVLPGVLSPNCTNSLLRLASLQSTLIAFAYEANGQTTLAVALPDGTNVTRTVTVFEKRIAPVRIVLKDLLVVTTPLGRIGFIYGREMYKPDFFAARDVDLLVTFGSPEFDEGCSLARRSARMVSEMIGAARFHASSKHETFAVSSDGIFQFRDEAQGKETAAVQNYRVKVTKNLWKWSGRRLLWVEYFVAIGFFAMIGLNMIPKQSAYDLTRQVSVFRTSSASS
jgi:hypothetical protein